MKYLKKFENEKDFNPQDYIEKDYIDLSNKIMDMIQELIELEEEYHKKGYWEDGGTTKEFDQLSDHEQDSVVDIMNDMDGDHQTLLAKLIQKSGLTGNDIENMDNIDGPYEEWFKKRHPDRWEADKFNM